MAANSIDHPVTICYNVTMEYELIHVDIMGNNTYFHMAALYCVIQGWAHILRPHNYPIVDIDDGDAIIHNLTQSKWKLQRIK